MQIYMNLRSMEMMKILLYLMYIVMELLYDLFLKNFKIEKILQLKLFKIMESI
jgi:hypothetical protein